MRSEVTTERAAFLRIQAIALLLESIVADNWPEPEGETDCNKADVTALILSINEECTKAM